MLKKELTIYERTGEGELIPQEVSLQLSKIDARNYPDFKKQTIKMIPLTRGEIKVLFSLDGKDTDKVKDEDTNKDSDAELIVKHCIDPVYTVEELVYAKPVAIRSIVRTILSESGVKVSQDFGTKSDEDEDELGKN